MALDQIPIGKFSKMVRLTPKALKIYEKKGLLVPKYTDETTGYRYYSISQIEIGMQLSLFAWAGFSLEEMELLLTMAKNKDVEQMKDLFKEKLEKIKKEQERLSQVVNFLDTYLNRPDAPVNDSEFKMVEVPGIRVVSMRQKGIYGKTISEMIEKLFKFIYKEGRGAVKVSGPIIFICHDDDYKEEDADIEIAIPIQGTIKAREPIEIKTLPEYKMISTLHKGPYEEISISYQKIMAYLRSKSLEPIDSSREVYITGPSQSKPEDYLTEIQFPIQKT